jgi:uncharacterized protein
MAYLESHADGTVSLFLHVQPKSSRTRIAGLHGDAVKLCVTAPPVEGRANTAIIRFLAKLLGIARSDVRIDSGESSRGKRLLLANITAAEVEAVLAPFLQGKN